MCPIITSVPNWSILIPLKRQHEIVNVVPQLVIVAIGNQFEWEANWAQRKIKGFPTKTSNCLITSTLMTVSGVGGRNLVNARIKQITLLTPHLNAAQCVRVIQTRKVRTGQNTSIYHRLNGINGYEFELLFKWVTKLYLWERPVLRIGFTSVKPKPSLLRETLKKLIIPIGPNIVFSWDLDKAWIIIDTQSWSSLLTTPALIASWFREPLQYGHLIAMLWFRP